MRRDRSRTPTSRRWRIDEGGFPGLWPRLDTGTQRSVTTASEMSRMPTEAARLHQPQPEKEKQDVIGTNQGGWRVRARADPPPICVPRDRVTAWRRDHVAVSSSGRPEGPLRPRGGQQPRTSGEGGEQLTARIDGTLALARRREDMRDRAGPTGRHGDAKREDFPVPDPILAHRRCDPPCRRPILARNREFVPVWPDRMQSPKRKDTP